MRAGRGQAKGELAAAAAAASGGACFSYQECVRPACAFPPLSSFGALTLTRSLPIAILSPYTSPSPLTLAARRGRKVEPLYNLTAAQQAMVLGGQACMWGEGINDGNFDAMALTKAAAVAERLWSPADVSLHRRCCHRPLPFSLHAASHLTP